MALHRAAQACKAKPVKTQPSGTLSRVLKRKTLPQRMSDRRGLSEGVGASPRAISVCSLESWWGEKGTPVGKARCMSWCEWGPSRWKGKGEGELKTGRGVAERQLPWK